MPVGVSSPVPLIQFWSLEVAQNENSVRVGFFLPGSLRPVPAHPLLGPKSQVFNNLGFIHLLILSFNKYLLIPLRNHPGLLGASLSEAATAGTAQAPRVCPPNTKSFNNPTAPLPAATHLAETLTLSPLRGK